MEQPKQRVIPARSHQAQAPKGVIGNTYDFLTDSENATIVRSVLVFGVRLLCLTGENTDSFDIHTC